MRSIEQSLASSTLRCTHAVFLASLSSLAYLASGCSAALRSWVRWRSVASLVCLAAGCSAALRTRRLSSLACLTSVCSDLLRSCMVSLVPTLQSSSSPFLSLKTQSVSHSVCSTCAKSYPFVQFKYSVYGRSYRTYTRLSQCSHASVGLAQARPNNLTNLIVLHKNSKERL